MGRVYREGAKDGEGREVLFGGDETRRRGPHSLCAVLTSQQDRPETKIPHRGLCGPLDLRK